MGYGSEHGCPKKAFWLGRPIVKPTGFFDFGGFFPRDAFYVVAAPYWPTYTSGGARCGKTGEREGGGSSRKRENTRGRAGGAAAIQGTREHCGANAVRARGWGACNAFAILEVPLHMRRGRAAMRQRVTKA